MAARHRRKNKRHRGSHSHGWGAKKKHRGSGNRGGAGHSGTGKRADSNKPSVWGDPLFEGRHGFHSVQRLHIKTLTVRQLDENLDKWIHAKQVEKQGEMLVIDLKKLGFDRVLGGGMLHRRIRIDENVLTKGAKRAVEQSKGELVTQKS